MTRIEWTDATWNPVRGCSVVSPGCTHCYAMKQAHRFSGPGKAYDGLTTLSNGGPVWTGKVRLVPELLEQPLRWRKPRRVFVNSMSDLFHEDVPFDFIDKVFAVMALTPQHVFQVLTKRPQRMLEYVTSEPWDRINGEAGVLMHWDDMPEEPAEIPPSNVWLGVSCEDERRWFERIKTLGEVYWSTGTGPVPHWHTFASLEPLLGPIYVNDPDDRGYIPVRGPDWTEGDCRSFLEWVIVGGESGANARPCNVEWIREVVRGCKAGGVPVFVKQLGSHPHWQRGGREKCGNVRTRSCRMDWTQSLVLCDPKGGDMGEWPPDLRVRECPS